MTRIFTKPTLLQRLGKTSQELRHEDQQRRLRNCFIALGVFMTIAPSVALFMLVLAGA